MKNQKALNKQTNVLTMKNVNTLPQQEKLFNIIAQYAAKNTELWGDRYAPIDKMFGDAEFERWVIAALVCAYKDRKQPINGVRPADCPYEIVKKAVQGLGRQWQRDIFDNVVASGLRDGAAFGIVLEDHANGGYKTRVNDMSPAPLWLVRALNAVQEAYDTLTQSFAAYNIILFKDYGSSYEGMQTPSINLKMKPGVDGEPRSAWFEEAMGSIDDIDYVDVARYEAWRQLYAGLSSRLKNEFGFSDAQKSLAYWGRVLRIVAEGRVAFGEPKQEVVKMGDRAVTMTTEGWNRERIEFLERMVYASDAYAGDPRDYDGQLKMMRKYERLYELCEAAYDDYKDVVEALCADFIDKEGKPTSIEMNVTLYTRRAGLWSSVTEPDARGDICYSEEFSTIEEAMQGAKQKRIHEQREYYRAREEAIDDRAKRVIAAMGWE